MWTFANEEERKSYFSPPQSSGISSLLYFFLPVVFMIATMTLRLYNPVILIFVGIMVLLAAVKVFLGRKARLSALELRLHPKKLVLAERYEETPIWRTSPLAVHAAASMVSLTWVSNGCHIEFRGRVLRERPLLLPLGLFSAATDIAALYRWAEEHGKTMEGPAPIPDAYVRPLE